MKKWIKRIEAKLNDFAMKNIDAALIKEGIDKNKLVAFYNTMKVNPDSSTQEPVRVYRAPAGHMNF